jgi:hypothetical protein
MLPCPELNSNMVVSYLYHNTYRGIFSIPIQNRYYMISLYAKIYATSTHENMVSIRLKVWV